MPSNRKPHIVNRILRPLGLSLGRAPRSFSGGGQLVEQRVGRVDILMPEDSEIRHTYLSIPGYCSHLGRVARCVAAKYPNTRVIDIGANVGDTVAVVKSAMDLPMLAIEGDDRCYEVLSKNITRFKGVTAAKVFLGEREESVEVAISKEGWNTTLAPGDASGNHGGPAGKRKISFQTLDALLRNDAHREHYKLIKLDTEGFDLRILRGAGELLRQNRPVLLLEYNIEAMSAISEDGPAGLNRLRELGYSDLLIWDPRGTFLFRGNLSSDEFLRDLSHYLLRDDRLMAYVDLCAFSGTDSDLAEQCAIGERAFFKS